MNAMESARFRDSFLSTNNREYGHLRSSSLANPQVLPPSQHWTVTFIFPVHSLPHTNMETTNKFGVPATGAPTPPQPTRHEASTSYAADEYELQTTPAETSSIGPPPSYHQIDPSHDLETASPPPPPPDADITDMAHIALPSDSLTSGTGNQHGIRATPARTTTSSAQRARAPQRLEPAGRICGTIVTHLIFFLLGVGVLFAFAFFIAMMVYHHKTSYNTAGEFYRFVGYMVMVEAVAVFAGYLVYTAFRRGLHR
ncbi:hypothetical protein C8A01DRAFT_34753 [Parachaetomium inaequale]|uniref:Uncharacterized protein n=1 Tax=Parachaetomium inaequale TaxID=2588326 RepID=A0AAN6PIE4_9PEZI|nr:hypothetical protein C8A01DRAFT_34753 [Parachaetomium inaequale]